MDLMGNKLDISEIFYSIQGESSYAGFPCVFVRLSGCNLRCNYCDAQYTWESGETMDIDKILSIVNTYPCDLVEVTGGEPLFQEHCSELLEKLVQYGKTVLLESNGSVSLADIPDEVIAIIDVKCPDSGSGNSFYSKNLELIRKRIQKKQNSCELKYVLSSRSDYLFAKSFIIKNSLMHDLPNHFSPVEKMLSAQTLAEWMLKDALPVRLQLQLHTILWPDITRGV